MKIQSVWRSFSSSLNYPSLKSNLEVDVAIIGGGITGMTAAYLLSKTGLKVALLERENIGENNTGHSTGNLYLPVDRLFNELKSKYDLNTINRMMQSRKEALELIEELIIAFQIDCDYQRVPWYRYSAIPETDDKIQDDFELTQSLELKSELVLLPDERLNARKAMLIDNQAQFNPAQYVKGLALSIHSDDCHIYENSPVEEIEEKDGFHFLTTPQGSVQARFLIHATHTPKGIKVVQTLLGPYREYGIACKIKDQLIQPGIHWGYYKTDEIFSVRSYCDTNEEFIIVVGGKHKVGQGGSLEHIKKLEDFAKAHFQVEKVTHRWGGQHYRSADYLPYIGRTAPKSSTFIATGFSTDGLVYGTLAAMIIKDQIQGTKNKYEDLYNAHRFDPLKSASHFIKENVNNANQYFKDFVLQRNLESIESIELGSGKIIKDQGKYLAAYKDENSELTVCSAICPHMGCQVKWNNAETSWDCPCHGSRFKTTGEVIEGPALKGLDRYEAYQSDIKSQPGKSDELSH